MQEADKEDRRSVSEKRSAGAPELERRRRALRGILMGGGVLAGSQAVPGKWMTPVIDSVLLPAHAQASMVTLKDPCQIEIQCVDDSTFVLSGFIAPPLSGITVTGKIEAFDENGQSLGTRTPSATTTNNGDYTFPAVTFPLGVAEVEGRTNVSGSNAGAICRVATPACTTTECPEETSCESDNG